MQKSSKHVSFSYQHKKPSPLLGESPGTASTAAPLNRARRMIQLGSLLESLSAGQRSPRTGAVTSLTEALQTKLLMDELKPADGSFAETQPSADDQAELGEGHIPEPGVAWSFSQLLDAKKQDMVAITKYLLERKKAGRPLTSNEDDELQKFYYDRASTILKKIILLKRGDEPVPQENFSVEEHAHEMNEKPSPATERAAMEVRLARAHAQAVVERLNFDAKVATANAAYNKKMLKVRNAV